MMRLTPLDRLNDEAVVIGIVVLVLMTILANSGLAASRPRPNVVLVMIDDMGYSDLSCHGSPFIKTPHLDGLHASSVRLTNFHVAPMCSPTRGQLLTGLDATRNGSTVVAGSRMMVRTDAPMLPAHFAAAGYATAIFGKWHLGENYPHRPQDRGFWPSPDLCTTLNERIWGKGIAVLLEWRSWLRRSRSQLQSGSSTASGELRWGLVV